MDRQGQATASERGEGMSESMPNRRVGWAASRRTGGCMTAASLYLIQRCAIALTGQSVLAEEALTLRERMRALALPDDRERTVWATSHLIECPSRLVGPCIVQAR